MTGTDPPGRPHQAGRAACDSMTRAASGPGTAGPDSPPRAVPVAFYGRTACAAGTGDSRADRRSWPCATRSPPRGWQVTAEFFNEDCRAGYPWQRRPQGRALLAALSGPGRVAGAVAVADPWRLLPRRPAPGGTPILARLAFRRVLLVLAGTGMVISSAEEYALLGRLLTGPPGGSLLPGRPSATTGRAAACPGSPPPGCLAARASPGERRPAGPRPGDNGAGPAVRVRRPGLDRGQPGPRRVPELADLPQPRPDRASRRDHRRRVLRHRAVPLAAVEAPARRPRGCWPTSPTPAGASTPW